VAASSAGGINVIDCASGEIAANKFGGVPISSIYVLDDSLIAITQANVPVLSVVAVPSFDIVGTLQLSSHVIDLI
jgi:hypothetical protein